MSEDAALYAQRVDRENVLLHRRVRELEAHADTLATELADAIAQRDTARDWAVRLEQLAAGKVGFDA